MTMLTKTTEFSKIKMAECFRFPKTYKGEGAEDRINSNGDYVYFIKTGCDSAMPLNADDAYRITYISMYTQVIPINLTFVVNE